MEVVDPSDPTGTRKTRLVLDREHNTWHPATVDGQGVTTGYVAPIHPDTQMTSKQEQDVADRQRAFEATERQRAISNKFQGLRIAQGDRRIAQGDQRITLAQAAQDNHFSQEERKELGAADKLRAQSEEAQREANDLAEQGFYKDNDTGETRRAKWAVQKETQAKEQAESLRTQLYDEYGYLWSADGQGSPQMTMQDFLRNHPSFESSGRREGNKVVPMTTGDIIAAARRYGITITDAGQPQTTPDAPGINMPRRGAPVRGRGASQPAPDVMTTEGRAQRDALRDVESQPNARLWVDVHLPAGVRDWSQLSSNDVAKEGVRQWAAQRGIPSDFTEKWLADNGSDENLHLYDLATQKPLTTGEAMGREDIYDLNNRSFRLSAEMPQFKKLQDDYQLSQLRSVPGMESAKSLDEASPLLRDLTVDSDETSPGEKFLAGATPVAHAALRTADLVTRPLQAMDAGFWAKVRGANDLTAFKTAYEQFVGDDPALGRNLIAEGLRNSDRARYQPEASFLPGRAGEHRRRAFERGPARRGAVASKLLRVTAAAERAGETARGLGLMDRGFVEARPLGLGDAALGDAAKDPELFRYARDRRLFYTEQAADLKDPVARVNTRALADDHAAEVARLEGGDAQATPAPGVATSPTPEGSVPARVVRVTSDLINAPKSIKSSIALHGPFRQGVFQIGAHPTFLQDAITQQVKAFASEDAYRAFAQSLTEKPWFQPMQDAGLFLPSTYDVEMGGRAPAWLREERFASAAAEKIPGARVSSRAYLGAMDSIRAQSVEHYLTTLYGPEMDLSKADPETLKALAEFVNISTGRGTIPILDRFDWGRKAAAAANNFLWSARALSSRANLVSPIRLMRGLANPASRPVALLQAHDSTRAALSVGATLSLLSLVPGVKVGLNPYKPGWGMVKVGNSEYDLLDGVPSTVKYAAQVGQALYRHAEGKPPAINRGGERTVYNLTKDFLRKRLSPSGQFAADYLTGKDAMGEATSASQSASDLLTPFTLEEMYKTWSDAGGSSVGGALQGKGFKTGFKGAAKGLPSAVGIPARTYPKRGEPLDLSDIAEP